MINYNNGLSIPIVLSTNKSLASVGELRSALEKAGFIIAPGAETRPVTIIIRSDKIFMVADNSDLNNSGILLKNSKVRAKRLVALENEKKRYAQLLDEVRNVSQFIAQNFNLVSVGHNVHGIESGEKLFFFSESQLLWLCHSVLDISQVGGITSNNSLLEEPTGCIIQQFDGIPLSEVSPTEQIKTKMTQKRFGECRGFSVRFSINNIYFFLYYGLGPITMKLDKDSDKTAIIEDNIVTSIRVSTSLEFTRDGELGTFDIKDIEASSRSHDRIEASIQAFGDESSDEYSIVVSSNEQARNLIEFDDLFFALGIIGSRSDVVAFSNYEGEITIKGVRATGLPWDFAIFKRDTSEINKLSFLADKFISVNNISSLSGMLSSINELGSNFITDSISQLLGSDVGETPGIDISQFDIKALDKESVLRIESRIRTINKSFSNALTDSLFDLTTEVNKSTAQNFSFISGVRFGAGVQQYSDMRRVMQAVVVCMLITSGVKLPPSVYSGLYPLSSEGVRKFIREAVISQVLSQSTHNLLRSLMEKYSKSYRICYDITLTEPTIDKFSLFEKGLSVGPIRKNNHSNKQYSESQFSGGPTEIKNALTALGYTFTNSLSDAEGFPFTLEGIKQAINLQTKFIYVEKIEQSVDRGIQQLLEPFSTYTANEDVITLHDNVNDTRSTWVDDLIIQAKAGDQISLVGALSINKRFDRVAGLATLNPEIDSFDSVFSKNRTYSFNAACTLEIGSVSHESSNPGRGYYPSDRDLRRSRGFELWLEDMSYKKRIVLTFDMRIERVVNEELSTKLGEVVESILFNIEVAETANFANQYHTFNNRVPYIIHRKGDPSSSCVTGVSYLPVKPSTFQVGDHDVCLRLPFPSSGRINYKVISEGQTPGTVLLEVIDQEIYNHIFLDQDMAVTMNLPYEELNKDPKDLSLHHSALVSRECSNTPLLDGYKYFIHYKTKYIKYSSSLLSYFFSNEYDSTVDKLTNTGIIDLSKFIIPSSLESLIHESSVIGPNGTISLMGAVRLNEKNNFIIPISFNVIIFLATTLGLETESTDSFIKKINAVIQQFEGISSEFDILDQIPSKDTFNEQWMAINKSGNNVDLSELEDDDNLSSDSLKLVTSEVAASDKGQINESISISTEALLYTTIESRLSSYRGRLKLNSPQVILYILLRFPEMFNEALQFYRSQSNVPDMSTAEAAQILMLGVNAI